MQSINKLDEKLKNMPKSAKTHPSIDMGMPFKGLFHELLPILRIGYR
jgi:hypothetical protein